MVQVEEVHGQVWTVRGTREDVDPAAGSNPRLDVLQDPSGDDGENGSVDSRAIRQAGQRPPWIVPGRVDDGPDTQGRGQREPRVGDVVQPGKLLMTLSPAGLTQLVVQIDEKNLRLLALGQQALASADAYPQQRFAAELAYINPGVNAQTGAVEVKLDVASPPPILRQDMTVSVDIEVARRAVALVVPVAAMHDAEGAAPWVLRVESGRALRRPVRLGLRGGGVCEVLDGVRAGDLLLPLATALADGDHVRVRGAAAALAATPAGSAGP